MSLSIGIVGLPNVGKSTLFNRIIGQRRSIVTDEPGMKKDELDIQVKGRTIQIAGVKTVAYGDEVSLHRRERTIGRFSRSLNLPVEIDADKIKAEYRDGILAIFLPRAEQDKPRSIKIA